jgi:hypothetical protein
MGLAALAETLDDFPAVIVQGMSYEWEVTSGDYTLSEYTGKCAIKLKGSSAATVLTAVESNNIYTFTLTATQTAALSVGDYEWTEYIEYGSGETIERYTLDSGTAVVRIFLGTAGTVDSRTSYKVALDAIEAVLLGRASKDQESFSIAGRSLSRTPIPDLMSLQKYYAAKVRAEEESKAREQGYKVSGKILVEFKEPQ